MSREKIQEQVPAEKERRWKQHLMSEGGVRDRKLPQKQSGVMHALGRGARAVHTFAKRNVPKGTFSNLGTAAGGAIANAPGAHVGGLLGKQLAQLVGFGDYKIRRNSLLSPDAARAASNGSTFSHSRANSVVISKRENVGRIIGTTAASEGFELTQYRIQPTDASTFPWLHNVANNFVEYDLLGMIVSYETTSSPYSSAMGLGSVGIATQYNASSLPYNNMESLLNAEGAVFGNPAEDIVHGVECDPMERIRHGGGEVLYTRRPGTRGPANLYDFGVINVGLEGIPSASVGAELGKIYVTYQIELDITALPVAAPGSQTILGAQHLNWNIVVNSSPPLGASLSLSSQSVVPPGDYGENMTTVGQASSDVCRLFSPGPPLSFPTIANEAQMAYWLNDSSLVSSAQYLGFMSAGVYDVTIQTTDNGETSPPASAIVTAQDSAQGDPTVWHYDDEGYGIYRISRWVIKTHGSGQQVLLKWASNPVSAYSANSRLHIVPRQEMFFPHTTGGAAAAQIARPQIEGKPEPEEVFAGDKGKWVETRVFVPEEDTPTRIVV